jgi:hypothetical protein
VVVVHEFRIKPTLPTPRFIVRRIMRRGMLDMISCIRGLAGGSGTAELKARDLGLCSGKSYNHRAK